MQAIEQKVSGFVQTLLTDKSVVIKSDSALITNGLIDSLAVIDLIGFLESEFGIKFESDEMTPENFDSLAAISALVLSKSGEKSGVRPS